MKKLMKNKIIKIGLKVIIYIFITLIVIYIALSLLAPKKVISTFNYQHFVIQTDSMEPVINVGDMIIIKEIDIDKLEKEDIITFFADVNADGKKEIVTHFFSKTELNNSGVLVYRTHRANTDTLDSWQIKQEDLIGEYQFRIPKVGKVVMFLQQPIGIAVLFIDLIIIYALIKISTKKDDEKKQVKEKE